MFFNPWSLLALVSAVLNFGLALHVYQRNPRALANRAAAALGLLFALWLFNVFLWYNASTPDTALNFMRVSGLGWVFLGPCYVTLTLAITDRARLARDPRVNILLYVPAAVQLVLLFSGRSIVERMIPTWYGYSYGFGPLHGIFFLHTIACCGFAAHVYRRSLSGDLPERRKRQMKLMYLSTVLIFLIGLPIAVGFAFLHIPGPDGLAPLSALAVDAVIFTAIMRYRLFVMTPEAVAGEILATIPEPVILLDDQRRVIEMNPSALMLTGYSRNDARGLSFENLIVPRDAHPPTRWRTEVAALGAPEHPAALLTRDGKRVPIAVSHTTVWDEFHQPAGSVILARDLRRSEEIQARLVQSEKLASIGQVAAGVAHEVNNPTTYILTNVRRLNALAQALEEAAAGRPAQDANGNGHEGQKGGREPLAASYVTEIAAQVRDISADCEEGATRIKNIVASLGAFSRMPARRREPVNLNEVLDSALKVLDARIRSTADVKRDFEELPEVTGDAGSLGQVALNLLMNALQAVEARGRRGRIEIRTRETQGWVEVELRDDGIGIGANVLPSIFDPFFTTKKSGEGTGLGLAICLDIVRRHGGDIAVESTPGEGSAFIVKLPLYPEPSGAPALS